MFSCNLPLAFWQNDRGLLRATAVTRGTGEGGGWGRGQGGGVDGTKYESAQKVVLEMKILPPLLPGLEPVTFRSRVGRSNKI